MRIYLDHAASTPVDPKVLEAIQPWLSGQFGNPSSLHAEGRAAKDAIDQARESVSRALGCEFGELVFTSGGTEAANLAVLGAALGATDSRRRRVLISAAEHHCVIETAPVLATFGFAVEYVPVDRLGRVDLSALESMLADDVLLVCVMHANNELGTWNPVAEAAGLASNFGALVFCDAAQSFLLHTVEGTWSVDTLGVDLLTISGQKVGAPKGVGALYVRAGTPFKPVIRGGGQERELRAGTENVAGLVGLGVAAQRGGSHGAPRLAAREAFEAGLNGLTRTVPAEIPTHPGILHVRALGLRADTLLMRLDQEGIAASSGAACSAGSVEASHVLLAAGFSPEEAKEGLRFSFSDTTSVADAKAAAETVTRAVAQVRDAKRKV